MDTINPQNDNSPKLSDRSGMIVFLFCLFFGCFGAHRFYVGRNLSAYLFLCTCGLCCSGVIFDLFLIFKGKFTDNKGRIIETTLETKLKNGFNK